MKRKSSKVVANATSMCILSPVLLIILGTMTEDHRFHISESLSASLGCNFFVWNDYCGRFLCLLHMECVKHIWKIWKKIALKQSMEYLEWYVQKRDTYEPTFIRNIAIGVVLCILSVIPLIIVGVMEAPDYICGISVGMLLIIIAVGVNLLIRTGMIKGSYDTLLQEGEFYQRTEAAEEKNRYIFWCILVFDYSNLSWMELLEQRVGFYLDHMAGCWCFICGTAWNCENDYWKKGMKCFGMCFYRMLLSGYG